MLARSRRGGGARGADDDARLSALQSGGTLARWECAACPKASNRASDNGVGTDGAGQWAHRPTGWNGAQDYLDALSRLMGVPVSGRYQLEE